MVKGIGPAFGFQPERDDEVRVMNRTGGTRAVGDVVQLDLAQAQSETTDSEIGTVTSSFSNVISVATAHIRSGIFCVVTKGGADDAELKVLFRGVTDVKVDDGNGDEGEGLVPSNAAVHLLEESGATDSKIVAKLLEDPGSDDVTLVRCWFNGIEGFGCDITDT